MNMPSGAAAPVHARVTRRALVDLALATVFVWTTVVLIHRLDLSGALQEWNEAHGEWAIDEFTLVSLCAAVALGVFSWRRWQESLTVIERHDATLAKLRFTESEIASRDRLIRSVSHELRTPLTALLGYAELLGDESIDGTERTEMVDTIVRQGRDLADIVEDLLTRAHVEAKTLQVALVPINLGAQAAQVIEDWNPEERARLTGTSDRSVAALGDPARVRQIIRNLVSNAFRYGDGTVSVSVESRPGAGALRVSNPGPQIEAAARQRIFEPYERIGGTSPAPGGLGLGLAISRQLARMMGGDLTHMRLGDQTVFELALPTGESRPA